MDRKEFIKKFSILSLGITTFPSIYAQDIKFNNSDLKKDPNGILDLKQGFSYHIISKEGQLMDDGLLVPSNADGMGCINGPRNKLFLIRNHELGHVPKLPIFFKNNTYGKYYKRYMKHNVNNFYDIKKNKTHCFGGTTTIVYNTKTKKTESQFLSLAGTLVNCSGGVTPWNTWISCEEIVVEKGGGITKNHGYNFEVIPSLSPNLNKAIPIKDMGRFRHEAVAFDSKRGYVYQTEDKRHGLFYRFIPNKKNKLLLGGKLQALSFKDWRGIDTANWNNQNIEIGKRYTVRWIDLNEVESPNDDLRYMGRNKGCATFTRGEGIYFSDDVAYFTATNGGKNKSGQIWKYSHKNDKEGYIELFYESKNSNILNMPDNIVVAPNGDIIICEDGRGQDRVLGIKKDGTIYTIAINALNNAEFAGVTFSPDGNILFINIYKPTYTLAIEGPWKVL